MSNTHDVVIEVRFPKAPGATIEEAVLRAGERLENEGFWAVAGVVDGMRRTLERVVTEEEREEAMRYAPHARIANSPW